MALDQQIQEIIDEALGKSTPCKHPWRHTVYGADDPRDNGTTCVMCGKRLK